MTTTSQFTLPERNGLVYKPHPQFLAQNSSKKVRLIHESLRYISVGKEKQKTKAACDSKEYKKNRTRKFSVNGKLAGRGYSMIMMGWGGGG